jgi:3',5'-cyclic AMP phosphodiesterase CpdA
MAWLALAVACSAPQQVPCDDHADCAAFGAGAVCRGDGFCEVPSDGGNGGDGRPGTDGGNEARWTFVSIPDFLNADVGDVSALTSQVNSTNAAHRAAIDAVLDAIAAEHPDFVMVAGDLVNGHWYADASGVGVFGPVGTLEQKAAAIDAAANVYYTQWKQRFEQRGLTVYPAVGDHDVGDNNWPEGSDKAKLVPTFKQAFARHFTRNANGDYIYPLRPTGTPFEGTAYAVRHKNVLIVTVDEFRQDDPMTRIDAKTGSVRNDVVGPQLAWLADVLANAKADPAIDHVIVQGHVPVLTPVRQQNSSGLTMPGGASSEFWQTLVAHDVDLYFAGEVHDMSAANHGGVEQVVHGGILGYAPSASFLVGHVYRDRIELELKRAVLVYPSDDTSRLWQAGTNRPRAQYAIGPDGFVSAGTLVLDKRGADTQYLERSGYFLPLGGGGATGLAVHLSFDEPDGSNQVINHGSTGPLNNGNVTNVHFVPSGVLGNAAELAYGPNDSTTGLPTGMARIVAGSTPISGAAARTTSVWFNTLPGAAHTNGIKTITSLGNNMPGGKWELDLNASGQFELGIAQGRTIGSGTPSLTDGTWHHVAAVLPDGVTTIDGARLYVDGEPITFSTTQSMTVNTREAGNVIVGHSVNSAYFQAFAGKIDDLSIWARALSDAEVRAITSFAKEASLRYDASDLNALFTGFAAQQDVQINGRLWRYQASGITGTPGDVRLSGSTYMVNLGGGAGFVSP